MKRNSFINSFWEVECVKGKKGSEKYPDVSIRWSYAENNNHEAYRQVEMFFTKHTQDIMFTSFFYFHQSRAPQVFFMFDIFEDEVKVLDYNAPEIVFDQDVAANSSRTFALHLAKQKN